MRQILELGYSKKIPTTARYRITVAKERYGTDFERRVIVADLDNETEIMFEMDSSEARALMDMLA